MTSTQFNTNTTPSDQAHKQAAEKTASTAEQEESKFNSSANLQRQFSVEFMPSEAAKKPSMMNTKRQPRDQSGEVKLPQPALSDNTQISGATWGELKEKAMQTKYFETSLFVKFLKPHEKNLLKQCIEAQKA